MYFRHTRVARSKVPSGSWQGAVVHVGHLDWRPWFAQVSRLSQIRTPFLRKILRLGSALIGTWVTGEILLKGQYHGMHCGESLSPLVILSAFSLGLPSSKE